VLYVCMSCEMTGENDPWRLYAGLSAREPEDEVGWAAKLRWSSARNVNGILLPAESSAITKKVNPPSET